MTKLNLDQIPGTPNSSTAAEKNCRMTTSQSSSMIGETPKTKSKSKRLQSTNSAKFEQKNSANHVIVAEEGNYQTVPRRSNKSKVVSEEKILILENSPKLKLLISSRQSTADFV